MKKRKIIHTLLIVVAFYLICNALVIYNYGSTDEKIKSDVIIVLGAETDENGVSPVYAERLNHGIWLYKNGYANHIIVTGGKAENMKFSDAYQAKQYVISKGISEDAVFMEEKSEITQENIRYAKEIMVENKWRTSIIVSDPLHMKRSVLMAEDYGLKPVSSPTPTSRYKTFKTKFPFLLREEFFYIGYKIVRLFGID